VNYNTIIIRYGEIALKAKETRKRFENTLISNLKNALNNENLSFNILKEWGRIYILTTQIDKCINILQKIFGIISISPSFQMSNDFDTLSKVAVDISKKKLDIDKSFAVRVTRVGNHDFTSQDVAIKIGSDIVKATKAKVNLTKPDFELFIEIRNNKAYIFTEKIMGPGGMPMGTQGRVLALINSLESILASWYLMRRGCKITFLFFKKFNINILDTYMKNWQIKSEVFSLKKEDNIYEEINKIADEQKCEAIVTDHSIYKSAKEILSELNQLKKSLKFPILNPLISMEKDEITKKCKEIGLPV
jgi:thiamine biosynthesis protein ThiI